MMINTNYELTQNTLWPEGISTQNIAKTEKVLCAHLDRKTIKTSEWRLTKVGNHPHTKQNLWPQNKHHSAVLSLVWIVPALM